MEYQTIIRDNGNEESIPAFVPQLEGELAIVHLDVLQKLASLLPSASVSEIRSNLISDIRNSYELKDIVERCKKFVAFHETVNLITEYNPEVMPSEADLCQDKEDEGKMMA
jgi:hypothetical protein